MRKHHDFVKKSQSLIIDARTYSKMTDFGRNVFDSKEKINKFIETKQFGEVVREMVALFDYIQQIDADKLSIQNDVNVRAEYDLIQNEARRKLEDHVSEISKDQTDFYKYTFELRKFDKENKYTTEFLNG